MRLKRIGAAIARALLSSTLLQATALVGIAVLVAFTLPERIEPGRGAPTHASATVVAQSGA